MRVALVRHPAVRIDPGLCYGRLDVALSPQGMAALAGMAAGLAGFAAAAIWSSPARRCVVVAAAIAEGRGWSSRQDARLLELDFGDWEGLPWDQAPRAALDRWAADPLGFAPPGGESGAALVARVRSFHAELMARPCDGVVVSHGGPLRVLAALLRGRAVDLLVPAPGLGSVDIVSC